MNLLTFQVLTPDGPVFNGQVEYVGIRGVDGDLGIMAGHATMLVGCRTGLVRVRVSERESQLFVAAAGLLSIDPNGANLLTVRAAGVPDERAGCRLAAEWAADDES